MIRALLIGTLLLITAVITEDGPPGFQTIVLSVEFTPGAQEAKHTHPGPLIGYILEGTLDLELK
jgi:quercetin dioxygenase-like cupin family protein